MNNIHKELKQNLPTIKFSHALSRYSTFQIGGPADYFYELQNASELPTLLKICQSHRIPFFIFGLGTNLLFHDKGFRGMVIRIATSKITIEDTKIIADAGVKISQLLNASIEAGLAGLEPWAGLPGTVGGAVRGNAGCNGLETANILTHALLLNPQTAELHEVGHKYFEFSYRHGKIKENGEIVLQATFQLQKRTQTAQQQQDQINEFQRKRITSQPPGCTTGCFFKNPSPDKPAGMLIDRAGLKGTVIGKAKISEKHGNFILNAQGATAKDIIKLAKFAQKEIQEKFDIKLQEEVQIISEYGPISLDNA